ncbi:MAG: ubiquinol-cytochrome c reductase iron-sulfur subunit [Acidobacteria bacterium]|nr:ubiquinol-cytochrome c reductase iron-sulfur subunit [Acidobacteriota bacterium]
MTPEPAGDRRTFFLTVLYSLWAVIAGALALPASIYLLLPPRLRKEKEWAEAGDIRKMEAGSPVEMVFRRNRLDGWRLTSEKATAWVVKKSDGEFVAFAPQCTHLGCAYHWDEEKKDFLCPCHSSTFSLDGRVTSGPAPRPLDRYEARVDQNKLLLGEVIPSSETTE